MGDSTHVRGVDEQLAEAMQAALQVAEAKVDKEIESLAKTDDDELDRRRAARDSQLTKKQEDKQKWIQCGHGEYSELPSEKDFFTTVQKSKLSVIHFYRQANVRCNTVDKHLKLLAPRHLETRFIKLNTKKCPFLVEKLVIKVLPTILIVIDSQIVDRIVGFTELGNCDDFTTEVLEWRLGVADGIHYSGDKSVPQCEDKENIPHRKEAGVDLNKLESEFELKEEASERLEEFLFAEALKEEAAWLDLEMEDLSDSEFLPDDWPC